MNESLHQFFLEQLNKIYDSETRITSALPRMASVATDAKLKEGFNHHLEETRTQLDRLAQVFDLLGTQYNGATCGVTKTLIDEGAALMAKPMSPELMDVALIGAAQQVEHHEIACYGTLCALAKQMGHGDVADLLALNLDEEKETDKKLSKLAEGSIFGSGLNKEANRAA